MEAMGLQNNVAAMLDRVVAGMGALAVGDQDTSLRKKLQMTLGAQ
jgi:hypothetical protein